MSRCPKHFRYLLKPASIPPPPSSPSCRWHCCHPPRKAPRQLDSSKHNVGVNLSTKGPEFTAEGKKKKKKKIRVEEETKPCYRHGPTLWAAQVHLVWFHSPGSGEERQGVQVSAEGEWESLVRLLCYGVLFCFFNIIQHVIFLNFLHVTWLLTKLDDLKIFWKTLRD